MPVFSPWTALRSGSVPFTGASVSLSTVRTQAGTPLAGAVTLASFAMPAGSTPSQLFVAVSAADLGSGATVDTVTWNGHTLTNLAEAVHPGNGSTASLHRWIVAAADRGATSNIVVDFDAASVANCLVAAWVVVNASEASPEASDEASATNSATIALPLTTSTAQDLVLDWLSHLFTDAADPAPSGFGQTEIAGAQVDDGAALLGTGSTRGVSSAGSISMDWSGMDDTLSSGVQVAVAMKPFSAPTQPATAKLVAGWDFSGENSTVTITGVGISAVSDSSGNGNTLTQTTDSRRLLYASTINGRSVANSSADTTKCLNIPGTITGWSSNGQPPGHILCVIKVNTWSNGRNVATFQNGAASPRFGIRLSTSGGNRIEMRTPTAVPGATVTLSTETGLTTGTVYLVEVSAATGGAAGLIVNEGTAATTTWAASGESLTLRRLYEQSSSPDLQMACCYIFNEALDAGELASWRTFLKYRWAYL